MLDRRTLPMSQRPQICRSRPVGQYVHTPVQEIIPKPPKPKKEKQEEPPPPPPDNNATVTKTPPDTPPEDLAVEVIEVM